MALVLSLGAITCYAVWRAGVPPVVAVQPIIMRMHRTCTACPNYSITLTSDGLLTYEGSDYALVRGTRTSVVDAATVDAFIADFLQSDFPELENNYPSPGTERVSMSLSIEMNGFSKGVLSEDRYGPTLLLELGQKFDDLPGMRALSGWTY